MRYFFIVAVKERKAFHQEISLTKNLEYMQYADYIFVPWFPLAGV